LTNALMEEYDRMNKALAEYNRKKAEVDSIRSRITSVSAKEQERLRLNIGGKKFEIRSTCVQKNTYFRALMNGTFTQADPDGFYFIDRSPEWFAVIINTLREGPIDLSRYDDYQLSQIRKEAEFYMVQELIQDVDRQRLVKKSGESSIVTCSVNTAVNLTTCAAGIAFEIVVSRREFKLHGISFVAGERRVMVADAYIKEGVIDSASSFRKIGSCDAQADRALLIPINITPPLSLGPGTYSIVVYSSASQNAIAVCSRKDAVRQQAGIIFGKTYCIRDLRAQITKRANEDEFDFCGELMVSFQ